MRQHGPDSDSVCRRPSDWQSAAQATGGAPESTTFAVADYTRSLQVYKATADFAAGSAMFNSYSEVTEEMKTLREEVIARREPRKVFVQPHISLSPGGGAQLHEFPATCAGAVMAMLNR